MVHINHLMVYIINGQIEIESLMFVNSGNRRMLRFKSITYHILFWFVFIASLAISEWGYEQPLRDTINHQLLFLPSRLFAVYLNWFILIPFFLYKNRIAQYGLLLLVVLAFAALGHRYLMLYWGYPKFFPEWVDQDHIHIFKPTRLLQHLLAILAPVLVTTGTRLFNSWYQKQRETRDLRQEKIKAELGFLKTQTNPHFLFNTLNSIYGLALEKSSKTPTLILKLSEILSYTLYGSDGDRVALDKELALIENIIELERERYGDRVQIDFRAEGNTGETKVAPLILAPFVENAFKHGIKNETEKGWIKILAHASKSDLLFKVDNSWISSGEPKNHNGLGLRNISRRLQLIYGKDHCLTIHKDKASFHISLNIKFN